MYFKQFYLGCLAHASYMFGSSGKAVVVDPQRDVEIYLEEAKQQGLKIEHIIETHLHADFVSGHRELARKTGAKIYYGRKADLKFEHVAVSDGDELKLGSVMLKFLETPGHTPESICVVIHDLEKSPEPVAILTGDTLFIGDVGRPDLVGAKISAEEMAGMLYDSLHQKILTLPDSVAVYPAHGAGSMCGKNISKETTSTLGQQRQFNYALKPMSRDEFIRMMTSDLPEAPAYFFKDAEINRQGPPLLDELPPVAPLAPQEVSDCIAGGNIVIDTRSSSDFGMGHIPGSINIGLSGQFASWAGTMIPLQTPIVLVADNAEKAQESRVRLARVGHDNVVGYLNNGFAAWANAGFPVNSTEQITVQELDERVKAGKSGKLIDVRRPGEWSCGHIGAALHSPLHQLESALSGLDRNEAVTVICAGGYRSSLASSILEKHGFSRVTNVIGGMTAWQNANLEVAK